MNLYFNNVRWEAGCNGINSACALLEHSESIAGVKTQAGKVKLASIINNERNKQGP